MLQGLVSILTKDLTGGPGRALPLGYCAPALLPQSGFRVMLLDFFCHLIFIEFFQGRHACHIDQI